MTTEQFSKLPLNVSLTMYDLLIIHTALFVSYRNQEKKELFYIAKETKDLYDRIDKIINIYQNII